MSLSDARGAVFVEKLIVYLPLLLVFFLTWELAELGAASLIVQRASAAAGRAAMVVLPDDPTFYSGDSVGAYEGERREDIELAAGMVLSATPKLGGAFTVDLDEPEQKAGSPFKVTVSAPYNCGALSLLCGSDGMFMLTATTDHVNQGARYQFTSPEGDVSGGGQALLRKKGGGNGNGGNGGNGNGGNGGNGNGNGGNTGPGANTGACPSKDCQRCTELKEDFDKAAQALTRWECVAVMNPGGENHPIGKLKKGDAERDLKAARDKAEKACKACGGKQAKDFKNDFKADKKSREKEWGTCKPKCDNTVNVLGRITDLLPWREGARTKGDKKVDVFDDLMDKMREPWKGNTTRRDWSLEVNGKWINDRIDNGNIFYMASDADKGNMSSAQFGCSAYAREIQSLINAGYRPYGNWWAKPSQASKCFPKAKQSPLPNTHCPAGEQSDPFGIGQTRP